MKPTSILLLFVTGVLSDDKQYTCDWAKSPPSCEECTPSSPTQACGVPLASCQATCEPAVFAFCNSTYQCQECTQGQPGCTKTLAVCLADKSCVPPTPPPTPAPQYNCDWTKLTCSMCNNTKPGESCGQYSHEVDCTSNCKGATYAKCVDGACQKCTQGVGCTETLAICQAKCGSPPAPTPAGGSYSCDWTQVPPKCMPCSTPGCGGSQAQCAVNCHAVAFGKCDESTWTCATCDKGTPGCEQTMDVCKASCHPGPTPAPQYKCDWTSQPPACQACTTPGCGTTMAQCKPGCESMTYSACDQMTFTCKPCTQGAPGCMTTTNCEVDCKKFVPAPAPVGMYA